MTGLKPKTPPRTRRLPARIRAVVEDAHRHRVGMAAAWASSVFRVPATVRMADAHVAACREIEAALAESGEAPLARRLARTSRGVKAAVARLPHLSSNLAEPTARDAVHKR